MNKYKVSEINNKLKQLIEGQFKGPLIINGEVSDISIPSSGHVYFSLKDDGGKIKAVYFKTYIKNDSFIPSNGDKVNAIGDLRLYAADGSYQIMVRKVIYDTEGDIWKRFEETKKRLAAEGLFAQSNKKSLPLFPKRIAILTALNGAAVKDFIITAQKNGVFFDIDIWPIPVQGIESAAKIAKTIQNVGKRIDLYHTLILTRGGGSTDDLAVFNEEIIARALKESAVPTISAIGHEHDFTISDFVADERVATPTAAAVRISQYYNETGKRLDELINKITTRTIWAVENSYLGLDKINSIIFSSNPLNNLQSQISLINNISISLSNNLKLYIIKKQGKLDRSLSIIQNNSPINYLQNKFMQTSKISENILKNFQMLSINKDNILKDTKNTLVLLSPLEIINKQQIRIKEIETTMVSKISSIIESKKHKIELIEQNLNVTNPENLLKQGYAIVLKSDGTIIGDVNSVSLEEELEIKLKDGYITTFVTGKKLVKNYK